MMRERDTGKTQEQRVSVDGWPACSAHVLHGHQYYKTLKQLHYEHSHWKPRRATFWTWRRFLKSITADRGDAGRICAPLPCDECVLASGLSSSAQQYVNLMLTTLLQLRTRSLVATPQSGGVGIQGQVLKSKVCCNWNLIAPIWGGWLHIRYSLRLQSLELGAFRLCFEKEMPTHLTQKWLQGRLCIMLQAMSADVLLCKHAAWTTHRCSCISFY